MIQQKIASYVSDVFNSLQIPNVTLVPLFTEGVIKHLLLLISQEAKEIVQNCKKYYDDNFIKIARDTMNSLYGNLNICTELKKKLNNVMTYFF